MNKENNKLLVSDIFVQYCKTKIKEQYLTYYEIAKRSQYYPSTMGFYFVESSNNKKMSYSMAIVILTVLHGRRFVSVDERVQFQKDIEHKFYFAFRQAFDTLNETYMQVEKKYGISHSTAFCYYNHKKIPSLDSAYRVSTLFKFNLPVSIDEIFVPSKRITIKEARLCAKLTQEEMSEIFGMRQQTIESLESGKRVLSRWIENLIIDKLLLIAKNKETTKRRKHYDNQRS